MEAHPGAVEIHLMEPYLYPLELWRFSLDVSAHNVHLAHSRAIEVHCGAVEGSSGAMVNL
jgi:hypothetical protein